MNSVKNNKKIDILSENLSRRIVILDGAMGTMIQKLKLKEVDFRGQKFGDHNTDVLGACRLCMHRYNRRLQSGHG